MLRLLHNCGLKSNIYGQICFSNRGQTQKTAKENDRKENLSFDIESCELKVRQAKRNLTKPPRERALIGPLVSEPWKILLVTKRIFFVSSNSN
jgi:hypothetical protein